MNTVYSAVFILYKQSSATKYTFDAASVSPSRRPYGIFEGAKQPLLGEANPLRTDGRLSIYTPANAVLPLQPLYQAAFEHAQDLHSLTT